MPFFTQVLKKGQTHHSHRFLGVLTLVSCLNTVFCKRLLNFSDQETLKGCLLTAEPVQGSKWLSTL